MSTHDETNSHRLPKYLNDGELTQECMELLPSLPKERGWGSSGLYQYQGFWHPAWSLQGVIACQKRFEAQDSDVLLVTSPKTGTTWLKALAFALLKRKDYPLMSSTHHRGDDHDHPLNSYSPHVLVPYLDIKIYVDHQNPDLSSYESPRLFATHLPFVSIPESVRESGCKIVYLCRNPKDTFVSFWHFSNKLGPEEKGSTISSSTINDHEIFEDFLDRFCRGVSAYGPYWDHVLGYWKQSLENPRRFLFLKYEELKENPSLYVRKLAEFLGCPFTPEEEEHGIVDEIISICSFENLSNLDVNKNGKLSSGIETKAFFRRGEVGDWKNLLTPQMVDRLNCLAQQKFQPFGLEL